MRMSQLFGQTLRQAPSEATVTSHQLLLRAGFIRQLAAGVFSYLHLARRSLDRIERIIRQEMDAIGGQEITMPIVHPADIWKETRRWYQVGAEMGRFQDRSGRDMVLAMTHEEVVGDLVRREIQSYRQLPGLIYHIQTKWRDEPRTRAGLIRVREFTMLDSYSLDADAAGLDAQYRAHYQAYFNVFNRCALPTIAVQSDVGIMGGSMAHEYMYLTPVGEDTIIICEGCGRAANRQVARFSKPAPAAESARPLERIATPGVTTIEELAAFLGEPRSRMAKAVFVMAEIVQGDQESERFVLALVRGDMDLNETKLANAVKARSLRPARDEEIRAAGAEPGYGSPVGLQDAIVVVDEAIPRSVNLVAGANEAGYHLRNVNYGRDFTAGLVCDIAAAEDGFACLDCGAPLRAFRGVEIGNIFKLGTRYSDDMGCTFVDDAGQVRPVVMGSYGIGTGRLLACVVEEHHDAHGMVWPISLAAYPVHLVELPGGEPVTAAVARLLEALRARGIEVLHDDREESAGVKFVDADLIGLPLRLTVSERSLRRGGVELKHRAGPDEVIVPLEEAAARVQAEIAGLEEAIARGVTKVPFVG